MKWIYLSPHFDDIALSVGGLVWEQRQAGSEVEIWTLCGGPPPEGAFSAFAESLHARWQTGPDAVAQRQAEDIASCQVFGAAFRHFSLPDCIYRPGGATGLHFYASEEAIFGEVHPAEDALIAEIARTICQESSGQAVIVSPLALGGHVDHRLARAAAEQCRRTVWYYADYPYVLKESPPGRGWQTAHFPVSPAGLTAWQSAIAAHQSQISTFWSDLDEMRSAIQAYWAQTQGCLLWKREPGEMPG